MLLLAAMACPAWAQVYKWVDAAGRVQYGDKPPGDQKSKPEQVKIAPSPPQTASAPSYSPKDNDFFKPKAAEKSAPKVAAPRPAPAPPDPCQRARKMVQAIKEKRAYRIYGNERSYPDAYELELYENDVKIYCR